MNKNKSITKTQEENSHNFISFNFNEVQILRDSASFEEMSLMIILKKRAVFKTGEVKGFKGNKLTYEVLAQDLSRPASQGKPAITISRQRARDIIARLETLGLVSDICTDNDELSLWLPMSPIQQEKKVETRKQEAVIAGNGAKAKRYKQGQASNRAEFHSGFPDMDEDSSVLISTISTKRSLTTEGEGAPSPFVAGNDYPHPISEEASPKSVHGQQLAKSFEHLLKRADFELTSQPLSRSFYQRWADGGISIEQVESAVKTVVAEWQECPLDRLLPLAVEKLLCANSNKKSTGRGRVSL